MNWVVHKFGGTSLADAECFQRVADIVLTQPGENRAVVVSAVGGITNLLFQLIDNAARREPNDDLVRELHERYKIIVGNLLPPKESSAFLKQFEIDLSDISSVLKALALVKVASHRSRDYRSQPRRQKTYTAV